MVIDAQDTDFADLQVWQDLDQDGVTDAGELKTLAALNIASINSEDRVKRYRAWRLVHAGLRRRAAGWPTGRYRATVHDRRTAQNGSTDTRRDIHFDVR